MGQYHYICNLDKREYLHPHDFGDGLKLMEFGQGSHGAMLGLALLLAASNGPRGRGGGDWHPWDGGPGYKGREAPMPDNANELARTIPGRWAADRIAIIGDYYEQSDFEGIGDNPWTDDEGSWTNISVDVVAAIEMDYYVHRERA